MGEFIMETTVQTKIPEQLLHQANEMVKDGWISDLNTLFAEALRRYIESHQSRITESFIREDIKWGLHGKD